MIQDKNSYTTVELSTPLKLSALWASLLFCYVYGDINSFFIPGGYITQSLQGKIGPFAVTQLSMLIISVIGALPCLMVFLSLVLKPSLSRKLNIGLACWQMAANALTFVSSGWAYFIFFGLLESALTVLIIRYAWKCPELNKTNTHERTIA